MSTSSPPKWPRTANWQLSAATLSSSSPVDRATAWPDCRNNLSVCILVVRQIESENTQLQEQYHRQLAMMDTEKTRIHRQYEKEIERLKTELQFKVIVSIAEHRAAV